MKKKMNIAMKVLLSMSVAALLPLSAFAAVTSTSTATYIGETKAQSIALEHAGVTAAQAAFIETNLDHEDGRMIYDVEFYSGATEYDYEIDAADGTVWEFDKDIEEHAISVDTSQFIGESKAQSIALANAGLTADKVTFTWSGLDYDDGRVDYELKFVSGTNRYYYEIDAQSGDIRDMGKKTDEGTSTAKAAASDQSKYVGEAKAKEVALADAKVSETQLRKIKVKLDREHGTMVYEVEFKNGNIEYEYEIDPLTAAILKSDVEHDD